MLAFHRACSYLEVTEAVAAVLAVGIERLPRRVPCLPHVPDASSREHLETISPETALPSGSPQGEVVHLGLLATAHVGEALSGDGCCGTATDKTYGDDSFHKNFSYILRTDETSFCHRQHIKKAQINLVRGTFRSTKTKIKQVSEDFY